ncbi:MULTISPECIES: hypothetical protein [unclassified Streptomyces]|uniref:hypothetical protein n=1 Tax=unclassified Streptomyces TaxID=2593676 RepID=UPI00093B31C9|nr:hypothetical protein [Streptomyces sp. TSRI0281]OKI44798.1 hypothetical protein A6A29_34270 [Streptomyces sp. TSRI0281]
MPTSPSGVEKPLSLVYASKVTSVPSRVTPCAVSGWERASCAIQGLPAARLAMIRSSIARQAVTERLPE